MDAHDGALMDSVKVDISGLSAKDKDRARRLVHQLNKLLKNPVSVTSEVEQETGLERIVAWGAQRMKPQHLDEMIRQIGVTVCSLGLNRACRNCPAKRYQKNKDTCTAVLGRYCITKVEKGNRDGNTESGNKEN